MPQSRRERREAEQERALEQLADRDDSACEYTPIAHHGRLKRAGGGVKGALKWTALVATMAVLAVATLGGLLFWSVQKDITYFEFTNEDGSEQVASLDGPVNFLLIGSDTRKDQGDGFSAEDKTSDLADVIMLLHISADHKTAVAVSFPRDLMVAIPSCTGSDGTVYPAQSKAQINTSITYGGAGCTALTVEKLTGIDISYAAKVDFKGVIEMTNAIGGVTVCVSDDINDNDSGLHLTAGEHTIQGSDALAFLRNRHGVGDGSDLGRISSQQVYLSSLVRKIKEEGTLTNPVQLYDLASAAVRNMQFSSNLSDVSTLASLAATAANINLDDVAFIQAPVVADPSDKNRVVLDSSLSTTLFTAIASGNGVVLNPDSETGRGSEVVGEAEDDTASASAEASPSAEADSGSSESASASPSASSSSEPVVLPEGIIGQTAKTKTCAKANN